MVGGSMQGPFPALRSCLIENIVMRDKHLIDSIVMQCSFHVVS